MEVKEQCWDVYEVPSRGIVSLRDPSLIVMNFEIERETDEINALFEEICSKRKIEQEGSPEKLTSQVIPSRICIPYFEFTKLFLQNRLTTFCMCYIKTRN